MIRRRDLISRHDPQYTAMQINAPLSVGNGRFCFTADFTGLQSFPDAYSPCPLCTMAEWGWHSYPGTAAEGAAAALRLTPFDTYGREVGYAVDETGQEGLFKALRQNPHKCNLASLGFAAPLSGFGDFALVEQRLRLWEGLLVSRFTVKGAPVTTETLVHPHEDAIVLRCTGPSPAVELRFPYGSHKKNGGDFSRPELHRTMAEDAGLRRLRVKRFMDDLEYQVLITLGPGVSWKFDGSQGITFSPSGGGGLELSLNFVSAAAGPERGVFPPAFEEAKKAAAFFWETYWREGGALDLGGSKDSRAVELERRIVLSQYLTAIQSRGSLPPAETGLTCNSWYGKFHLEMHYWHSAHFALWGRDAELERSLSFYRRILPEARRIARSQGYAGGRWPKMCGPEGRNSPSSIAVLLVWQQGHPILLAELCYRARVRQGRSGRDFLEEYFEVVEVSAEFMVSFLHWDGSRYVLGPPLIPAQERFDPRTVLNPGYETEYFRWALVQTNIWRKRLGLAEREDFRLAAEGLARPVAYDGVFPAHEACPSTFTEEPFFTDHPSMLGMCGLLPGAGIDPLVMNATLDKVLEVWDRPSFWGWDFPMMAMTAARLGRAAEAVEFLLMESPKNTWLPNGHNAQGDREDLPLYLPGNGGLLLATAMMAAGWDRGTAPGFPKDGSFKAEAEGFLPYI